MGAFFTAAMFMVGQYFINLYIQYVTNRFGLPLILAGFITLRLFCTLALSLHRYMQKYWLQDEPADCRFGSVKLKLKGR